MESSTQPSQDSMQGRFVPTVCSVPCGDILNSRATCRLSNILSNDRK